MLIKSVKVKLKPCKFQQINHLYVMVKTNMERGQERICFLMTSFIEKFISKFINSPYYFFICITFFVDCGGCYGAFAIEKPHTPTHIKPK